MNGIVDPLSLAPHLSIPLSLLRSLWLSGFRYPPLEDTNVECVEVGAKNTFRGFNILMVLNKICVHQPNYLVMGVGGFFEHALVVQPHGVQKLGPEITHTAA